MFLKHTLVERARVDIGRAGIGSLMTERMDSACCSEESFLYWNGGLGSEACKDTTSLTLVVSSPHPSKFTMTIVQDYSSQMNSMWLKIPSEGVLPPEPV